MDFLFFWFLSKLLRLLLNVTKVTTEHQKLPKLGQNSMKSSFFARRAKKASAEGPSPPQELEVGPRSGPYLLVFVIAAVQHCAVQCILVHYISVHCSEILCSIVQFRVAIAVHCNSVHFDLV